MILSLQNLYPIDPSLSWLVWVHLVDSISPLARARFNRYDKKQLIALSHKFEIPEKLVTKLIDLELQTQGMSVRHSIYKRMDKIFREEWRSEEEILEEYKAKKQ